jgi:hypothetical protein
MSKLSQVRQLYLRPADGHQKACQSSLGVDQQAQWLDFGYASFAETMISGWQFR